ncbi:hypothetical protein E5E18_06195 [Helicobacter pylori]|nr:hypothetical protein E5E18_06195 [Helicobacter pylori]
MPKASDNFKNEKIFFSVFVLFSGKLGVNSSGSFKKALFYIGGLSWRLKKGGMVSNASYLFKRIKFPLIK